MRRAIYLIFLVVLFFIGIQLYLTNRNLNQQISLLSSRLADVSLRVNSVEKNVANVASSTGTQLNSLRTLVAKPQSVVTPKSQDQLIREAVAAVSPAVVSIVISENVPDLEVVYINPFGDNPAFEDISIRIPVYRQRGTKTEKVGAGTGFFISSTGYIVTNKHVVSNRNAQYTVLLANGSQVNAQVVYRDPNQDMAIIKIPGTYKSVASVGDSSTLALGQTVIAIGNALGEYNNTVSLGIVSGLNRDITAANISSGESEDLKGVIQVDAAINPGNSGGPLIDLNGKVVGITVATVVGSNNIGFVIPISSVRNAINTFTK